VAGLAVQKVRESGEVKLFAQGGEIYVLAKSQGRQAKENAMRRKELTRLLRKFEFDTLIWPTSML